MPFPFPRYVAELAAGGRFFPEPPRALVVPDDTRERWALATLDIAIGEIGHGETEGNNRGPDIARYCAPHGDGWLWCAGFQGWNIGEAAWRLNMPMLVKKSLRAKVLAENIAAIGHRIDDWRDLRPGDFGVLKRGAGGHHIFIVEARDGGATHTVEGNRTPQVGRFVRLLDRERWAFGASLRKE